MKKILILFVFLFPLFLFSQVSPPDEPDNEIAGNAIVTGTLQVGEIPIITDDTYQIVVDASGNFGYYGVAPVISCYVNENLFQFGTRTAVRLYGSTSNPISPLELSIYTITGTSYSFLSGVNDTLSYSDDSYIFLPIDSTFESNTFVTSQDWVSGSNGATITCSNTINSCYPYHYGVTTDDLTTASGTTIYLHASIYFVVDTEPSASARISVTFTGNGYPYVIVPESWSDLTEVKDATGTVIEGWNKSTPTISSSGLDTDYIGIYYDCWQGGTTGSYTGQTYTFKF